MRSEGWAKRPKARDGAESAGSGVSGQVGHDLPKVQPADSPKIVPLAYSCHTSETRKPDSHGWQ